MHTTSLAAAILAGGRARRFGGVNKGALPLGSLDIVGRQLQALRNVAGHVFVVGRATDGWSERGLTVVPDDRPECGPLGGIYTAIRHSPCERTLVVACDLPFLTTALLERLARESADAVVPRSARGLEPLCAIYARSCLADIGARLDRGELEASVLPSGARVIEIGQELTADGDPEGRLFLNVNTPQDYERARRIVELNLDPDHESTEDRITTEPSRTPPAGSFRPTK